MTALIDQNLQNCNRQSVALSPGEISLLMKQLSNWNLIKKDDIDQLVKSYTFKNFSSAMAFANDVASIADIFDHHPCICIEWGKATVSWWTHSISGLIINDFIMAAKCDAIFDG